MFVPIGYLVGGVVGIGGGVVAAKFMSNKRQKVAEYEDIPVITACLEPSLKDRTDLAAENVKLANSNLDAVDNEIRKLEEEFNKQMEEKLEKRKAAQDQVNIHATAAENVKAIHDAIHHAVAIHTDPKVATHATVSKRKRA